MTATQRIALVELGDDGPLRLNDLAKRMGTSTPTASRSVDALEALGLVTRAPESSDRRALSIDVTPRGRDLLDERLRRAAQAFEPAAATLSAADRRELLALLRRMTDALARHDALAVAVLERGLAALRLGERERPRAHTVVEVVLDLVDRSGARVRLRPEVARIGRVAAELEADQVVLLERRRRAAEPVLPEPLRLERVRVRDGRPDGARPAVTADRRGDRSPA